MSQLTQRLLPPALTSRVQLVGVQVRESYELRVRALNSAMADARDALRSCCKHARLLPGLS
eukprot:753012-Hanusia_phi.AAC.4